MKTLLTLSFAILVSASIFAQASANASATVMAQLKKGLSISNVNGDLDFGEIILTAGTADSDAITPDNGVQFEVIGHPNKDVTITFSDVTLDNDTWVGENGGTSDQMTFTPDVEHTGSNSTYTTGTTITSGNAYTLQNVSGDGYLYLWLGGSIAWDAAQEHGDYTGTFEVTVAY